VTDSDSYSEQGVPPLAERRQAGRQRVFLGGKIVFQGGAISVNCAIRDMSATGARIAVPGMEVLPNHCFLIDIRKGMAHQVEVVWMRMPQYGLRFVKSHRLENSADPEIQFLRRLWSDARAR
jgi:hypothetical protein